MASVGNVADVTGTAAANAAAAVKKSAADEQQDRFLKLLVTQMKNQDPLNPLDNAQVTSQMAQLSTVTGIEKLNATLQAFSKSQAFQAAGMIGRNILAPGDTLNLKGGMAAAGIDLPKPVDKLEVSVLDAAGNVVSTRNLGKHDEGVTMFQWDGKSDAGVALPDGAYTFRVAGSFDGEAVLTESLAVGEVTSVLMDAIGPALSVRNMGLVDLDQIRQIL